MIKALFLDIDGTMVSFKTHRMSDNLKASLREVRAKGVKVFVCTGRSPLTFDPLESFPFDGYVSMNGALSVVGEEVVDSHPIDRDLSMAVADFAMKEMIPCWVFSDKIAAMNVINGKALELSNLTKLLPETFVDLRDVAREDVVYEYSIFMSAGEIESRLAPLLPGAEFPRWNPYFCDIIMPGLSKAQGAAKVLERIGVAREECMAFGDGGNDTPVLEFAGIGVAMGNAGEDVKSKADYVTLTVDEDGIPAALRHFGVL